MLMWVTNVFLIKWLPLLQKLFVWVYVSAFIALITVMWVKAHSTFSQHLEKGEDGRV